ncbi:MAG: dethiobiotin synthase [Planctomycetota bacterium]
MFPSRGLFVTGTDTEVGKTYICELLARQLVADGHRVGVYKPAASGGEKQDGRIVCEDAVRLWEAADRPADIDVVCPQMFLAAVAPHVAARMEDRTVDDALLLSGLTAWHDQCDFVIVEGAGGYFSPISDTKRVADVACEMGYPALVVTANRLGTINQTLQTLEAVRSYRGGLPLAGVVMNDVVSAGDDESLASNPDEVERWMGSPLLARVTHSQSSLPSFDWCSLFGPPS